MSEYKRGLPPAIMEYLLGAIADPRNKPNDQEIYVALEQLAEAVAAIVRAAPGKGLRDRFEMQLGIAMERRTSPNDPIEEE